MELFVTLAIGLSIASHCAGSLGVRSDEPVCIGAVTLFQEVSQRHMADFDDVASQVEWFTGIDITDANQLTQLACSMQSKSVSEIADILTSDGIVEHAVRRLYGLFILGIEEMEPALRVLSNSRDDAVAQIARLRLQALTILRESGVLNLDQQAVNEAAMMLNGPEKRDAEDRCEQLSDISTQLLALQDPVTRTTMANTIYRWTGLHVRNREIINAVECEIIAARNIGDIVDLFNEYNITDHLILYGINQLRALPSRMFPLQLYMMFANMPEEEFAGALGMTSTRAVAIIRQNVLRVVNFNSALQEFLETISY